MKHLQDYIVEQAQVNEAVTEKKITFNFKDLENAEETIKSLEGKEGVEVEEDKLTVTVSSDTVDKLDTVQDILQQFCDKIRNSQKRSSDESYAQKTVKFADKVNELNDAIDEIKNPEEDDENNNGDKDETKDDK